MRAHQVVHQAVVEWAHQVVHQAVVEWAHQAVHQAVVVRAHQIASGKRHETAIQWKAFPSAALKLLEQKRPNAVIEPVNFQSATE